ncbi:3-oxoacyl-[acyl-carrier-protein] reductase FabG [Planctomycetes bacterium Poly30]|uniref:3-oxoacyl-[acyl-carrier-protein] reductase FabG n=1 Tax=Saltatorellus ferox TaxID=2528018 RepID=A0A518ESJ6_9BACT|nr:3-oxoacyl-[acyl-carrier-protein] reductase FabG [Planctomycetes bacterium Poly30]
MSPKPLVSLEGRVALVTGSTTGLGKSIAARLADAGAKVAMNYANNTERAEAAFETFRKNGGEGALFRGDVTDEADVPRLIEEIKKTLGPVDVVVCNATPDQPQKPIEQYDWAFHQQMIDFFVKSPFLLARAVLPHMKKQRWGRFLNIGSEVFDKGLPNFSPYVAAKGAQRGWTRSMANELAPYQITVNMVSPGWIPVERHENDPEEAKRGYLRMIPLQRWGVPDDIGHAVAFMCSEQAGFVTGQTLVVNGGMTVS